MWKREVGGQVLTFHLAGINNQNFLMRDEETGSFWQQISGKAISGPLAGQQLELVRCDELSFDLWRKENPGGTVLLPVKKYADEYEKKDWEKTIGKHKTVVDTSKTNFAPRELMLGVEINGASRAYPFKKVLEEKMIQDRVGGGAIIVVVGPDNQSVRVFSATSDFYRKQDAGPNSAGLLIDAETGSEWDFKGCAVSGPAAGRCLPPVNAIKDYWFDWRLYHPTTTVYAR